MAMYKGRGDVQGTLVRAAYVGRVKVTAAGRQYSTKGAGCMPEDARPGRVRIPCWLGSEWEGSGVAWSGEVRRSVAERAVSVRQWKRCERVRQNAHRGGWCTLGECRRARNRARSRAHGGKGRWECSVWVGGVERGKLFTSQPFTFHAARRATCCSNKLKATEPVARARRS